MRRMAFQVKRLIIMCVPYMIFPLVPIDSAPHVRGYGNLYYMQKICKSKKPAKK
jgi:hypothetical protein